MGGSFGSSNQIDLNTMAQRCCQCVSACGLVAWQNAEVAILPADEGGSAGQAFCPFFFGFLPHCVHNSSKTRGTCYSKVNIHGNLVQSSHFIPEMLITKCDLMESSLNPLHRISRCQMSLANDSSHPRARLVRWYWDVITESVGVSVHSVHQLI